MKKYILVVDDKNEIFNFHSKTEGFNSLEVLGILTSKQQDILRQMSGAIKPNFVKRNVVIEKTNKKVKKGK